MQKKSKVDRNIRVWAVSCLFYNEGGVSMDRYKRKNSARTEEAKRVMGRLAQIEMN